MVTNLKRQEAKELMPIVNKLKTHGAASKRSTVFRLLKSPPLHPLQPQDAEGYRLTVGKDTVTLSAPSVQGVFYGLQTLCQLDSGGVIPNVEIIDRPRFAYRGLMIDCSRHFWSVDFIKKQIDAMALLKLNKLHLHLVDGGGWRLQLDRYPELVENTAYRMESDWDKWTENGRKYVPRGTPGAYGGYYTKNDIRHILEYAHRNQIEVIPEIEMPGHSNEVMAVFPELSCTGKGDGFDLCVGNPKTLEFLTNVLEEVIDLFPSKYIHIGGDEATMRFWKKCPKCLGLMDRYGYRDTLQIQAHLISRIDSFLVSRGKILIGWDEILEHTHLSPRATVMSWRGEDGAVKAAKEGRHVIVTPSRYYYLDHLQGPLATEPKALGGFSPLERVYHYNPIPTSLLDTPAESYIDGVQGNLWTEYVETEDHAEYMIYPRLLAIAETGWGTKTGYDNFVDRAEYFLQQLRKAGYRYRPFTQKEGNDLEFTVLQWNIWQEGTMVENGFQSVVDEIERLKPDFVTLSEVRNYHGVDFTHRLCEALGKRGLAYYSFKTVDSGLLSRYPLTDSLVVFGENKDHGSVYKLTTQVDGETVSVYTCHLDYLDCAYYNVKGYDGSTWKATSPPQSVEELLRLNNLSWRDNAIQCFLNEARHDLAAGHLVVLGGDFNEPSHLDWTESTKKSLDHHGFVVPWTVSKMLYKAGYVDSYRVIHPNPVTHPGLTYPSDNPFVDQKLLTWAPLADERERIDFIYYQGNNLFPIDAKVFGPDRSIVRGTPQRDTGLDTFITPQATWPTDHRGVLVRFRLKRK